MEHISAIGMATARVRRLTPMKLNTITGGPPDVTPTMKTPLRAVHLFALVRSVSSSRAGNAHDVTTLKLNPIILSRPKDRLSSKLHVSQDPLDKRLLGSIPCSYPKFSSRTSSLVVPLNTASSPSFDMVVASSCIPKATNNNRRRWTKPSFIKPEHLSFTPCHPMERAHPHDTR